jgi:pantetheine-phosphate adenylyltransferase
MVAKKVALGGTFEPLHEGHKKLIEVAMSLGEVTIGVTNDDLARKRLRSVLPYEIRAENIKRYILSRYGLKPEIIRIDDVYGNTLDVDFDYIVVSPETYDVALVINRKRRELNKREIEIIKVDFILAQDGKPISSTRIKCGEIDRFGSLI